MLVFGIPGFPLCHTGLPEEIMLVSSFFVSYFFVSYFFVSYCKKISSKIVSLFCFDPLVEQLSLL